MTISAQKTDVRWKVRELLDEHLPPITRYALQKEAGVAMNTIRAMYDGTSSGAEFGTLSRVLRALRVLTGNQRLGVCDLLTYEPAPADQGGA